MNQQLHAPGHLAEGHSNKFVLYGIILLAIVYAIVAIGGLPQRATQMIVAAQTAEHHDAAPATAPGSGDHHGDEHGAAAVMVPPPLLTVIPFVLLLGTIAVFPLLPKVEHWWESNLNRFYVAALLAIVTLIYYLFVHRNPIEGHWPVHHLTNPEASGVNLWITWDIFANAILSEYIPFIVLLFSLYTISGGIRIEGDLRAHALTNTTFLMIGGLLASVIGTTGAAMLLIRPLLETNHERKKVVHTVVFFIFVVCNCGGCLLPLGDPPLFLGYLLGVPFLFTLSLWKEWLFVNGMLFLIYFLLDHLWFYPHEEKRDIQKDEVRVHGLRIGGLWPNAFLLGGVIFSIALLGPTKPFPGTDWHPWLYLREIVQLLLVAASLWLGSKHLRERNHFNYAAIIEVAALFFGIFLTMQPALQILSISGPRLGLTEPWHFFWATGGLSSFLDNAPTYVVFFTTAKAITAANGLSHPIAGVSEPLLTAISLAAVFMGAMTYIGNGPNFMVKAIAEKSGVKMPSFFGFMLYSILFLIPLFILTAYLFL